MYDVLFNLTVGLNHVPRAINITAPKREQPQSEVTVAEKVKVKVLALHPACWYSQRIHSLWYIRWFAFFCSPAFWPHHSCLSYL